MATHSIYRKVCPSCAAFVEREAGRCACGHSFESESPQGEFLPEDQAAQDEELLTEYLKARVAQAVEQLQEAQTALTLDPKNIDKINRLMKVYVEVNQLRAELGGQEAKAAQARAAARAAHGEEAPETPIASGEAEHADFPTETFRAVQAEKAQRVLNAAGMDTKVCERCHAVLPQRAALCFCGHAFAAVAPETVAPETTGRSSSLRVE